MLIQSFPSRDKNSLIISVCRQTVTKTIEKWLPLWSTFGSCISILPRPHDYYSKDLPDDFEIHGLPKVTHLFDGKDIIVETMRK